MPELSPIEEKLQGSGDCSRDISAIDTKDWLNLNRKNSSSWRSGDRTHKHPQQQIMLNSARALLIPT